MMLRDGWSGTVELTIGFGYMWRRRSYLRCWQSGLFSGWPEKAVKTHSRGRPIPATARWLAHSSFGIFIESTTAQVRIKTTLDTGCEGNVCTNKKGPQ